MNQIEKSHEGVKCPHCGHLDTEVDHALISYHGEQDPVVQECERCEQSFYATESVKRHWVTTK